MARAKPDLRLLWRPWLHFVIPGEARPKKRPRFGRNKHTGRPIVFQDSDSVGYERWVSHCAQEAPGWTGTPLDRSVPVRLEVRIYCKRPRSAKSTELVPAKRPDLDNYIKAIVDGLDVIWHDDAQVVSVSAEKLYVSEKEAPRVEVDVDVGEVATP